MCDQYFLVISLIVFHANFAISSDPIVVTAYGKLEGRYYHLKTGEQAIGFLGIPYASPPVGQLRFKPTQPPQKWDGVQNVTEFPKRCMQTDRSPFHSPAAGQSEDCLYLNVFTPKITERMYPVMVFIHGGSFIIGSTYDYGDQGICDFLVSKGVVVVVIQYRLGLFGNEMQCN